MHLHYRNVNEAFYEMVRGIYLGTIPVKRQDSRNGPVLRIPEPVTVTYARPTERVLFHETRDCNPFFHLFESMWMLAGSELVEPVAYYNRRMRDYSDDGETFHGAYGYRWRQQFGYDQVAYIADELRKNPDSRRCVLQIWDATVENPSVPESKRHDLWTACNGGRDIPCNTQVYFCVIDGALDMTVCNRSNDMVWGMLGANVVHFSYLQEYIACLVGIPVGRYHQVTNNLHVYEANWRPLEWMAYRDSVLCAKPCEIPLVSNQTQFDYEVSFIARNCVAAVEYTEPYLRNVVVPMCMAFKFHKSRDYEVAHSYVDMVEDEQWHTAGKAWLRRREENWRRKNGIDNPYLARELDRQAEASTDQG